MHYHVFLCILPDTHNSGIYQDVSNRTVDEKKLNCPYEYTSLAMHGILKQEIPLITTRLPNVIVSRMLCHLF